MFKKNQRPPSAGPHVPRGALPDTGHTFARSDTCIVKRSLPPGRRHREQTSWTVSNAGSSRCPSPVTVVPDTVTAAALAPGSLNLPSQCQAMEEAGKSHSTGHVLLLEALPPSVPAGTVSGGQAAGERLRSVLGRTREWKLWLLQNIRISSFPSVCESRGGLKPGACFATKLENADSPGPPPC